MNDNLNELKSGLYVSLGFIGVIFFAYYMSDIAIWLVKPRNDLVGAVQEPCQDEAPSYNGAEPIISECAP